jgi:hypothetical protein
MAPAASPSPRPADEPREAVPVAANFSGWNLFAHPLRRQATAPAATCSPGGGALTLTALDLCYRSDLNAARISVANSSGSSQAAK